MGMSSHVKGFAPPDDRWHQMRAVHDACTAAGVPVPHQVHDFFGGDPDASGQEVDVPHREWRDDDRVGFEVDVADLPQSVKTIRFYNSW